MPAILNPPPHIYTNVDWDRAADRRKDDAWLSEARNHPESRVIVLSSLRVLVEHRPEGPQTSHVRVRQVGGELPDHSLFLGLENGIPVFALDVEGAPPPARSARWSFVELRSVGAHLSSGEAGLLAYARGLVYWHSRHRFCSACGGLTGVVHAGHARQCQDCEALHFPRTDPAVIVLVTHGDRCLLGRSRRFVEGMYSTLAGFVEPGESLEECLRREVYEESGIRVGRTSYQSSQPWPFPASLMLGFRAEALNDDIRVDPDELDDAAWFERVILRDPDLRPVRLPNPDSIARHLIESWLAEGD